MKISTKRILIALIAPILFNGCISTKETYYTSKVALNNKHINKIIAEDIVSFLKQHYPIKTTFSIKIEDSSYTYGVNLEDHLRKAGYGLIYIPKKEATPFAYKLDFINKNIIRATYNIGSANISRLYRQNQNTFIPITPFTTRGLKNTYIYNTNSLEKTPNHKNTKEAIVTAHILNARSTPSTQGKITMKYTKDSMLIIGDEFTSDTGQKWCQVYNEYPKQYVSCQYIKYLN